MREITHPSEVPYVFDSGVHLGATYSDLAYRHDLRANAAYTDGHILPVKFLPERAFPNIVLLPSVREDPDDHSGIPTEEFHEGEHPVTIDGFAMEYSKKAYIDIVRIDNETLFNSFEKQVRAEAGHEYTMVARAIQPAETFTIEIIGFLL